MYAARNDIVPPRKRKGPWWFVVPEIADRLCVKSPKGATRLMLFEIPTAADPNDEWKITTTKNNWTKRMDDD
jgi:hypothetical protein